MTQDRFYGRIGGTALNETFHGMKETEIALFDRIDRGETKEKHRIVRHKSVAYMSSLTVRSTLYEREPGGSGAMILSRGSANSYEMVERYPQGSPPMCSGISSENSMLTAGTRKSRKLGLA